MYKVVFIVVVMVLFGFVGVVGLDIIVVGEVNGMFYIDLFEDVVLLYVVQIIVIVEVGDYNDVVFYCVIDGFMVQIGDVVYGKLGVDMCCVGIGGLDFGII